jgi:hypothetical protein
MLRRGDRVDRAQLLVTMALLLGVVFVVLAVVVNGAVFTENLATRDTVDSERSTAFTANVESAIEERYDRTNSNASHTAPDARSTFDDSFQTWADQRSDVAAAEGGLFRADWTTHVGWRIDQLVDDGFAPADAPAATDWTVVEDARNVSTLRLDVTREHLYNGSTLGDVESDAFRVIVSNGSTDWELYVLNDKADDEVVVFQGDPNNYGSYSNLVDDGCGVNADRAVIDFLTMTVNAQSCTDLAFEDDLSGPVTISYENVNVSDEERVNGTYTVVVNGSDAVATNNSDYPKRFNVTGSGEPAAHAVVYAVDYTATYERADVDHHRDDRYAPRAELY